MSASEKNAFMHSASIRRTTNVDHEAKLHDIMSASEKINDKRETVL